MDGSDPRVLGISPELQICRQMTNSIWQLCSTVSNGRACRDAVRCAGYLREAKQALKLAVFERAACTGLAAQKPPAQQAADPGPGTSGDGPSSSETRGLEAAADQRPLEAARQGPGSSNADEGLRCVRESRRHWDHADSALALDQ